MADKKIMTPEEKAPLQARHRQEEAEARNRKKERDARTHNGDRSVPLAWGARVLNASTKPCMPCFILSPIGG